MPVFEDVCACRFCDNYGLIEERYFPRNDTEAPVCRACGHAMERLVSKSNLPFLGPITARYNDKRAENAHADGHWAYRKRTLDGVAKPEFIDTWDKQKQFCKEEGLILPSELPSTPTMKAGSGKEWSSVGMPGSWSIGVPPEAELSTGRRLSDDEMEFLFPRK